MASSGGGFDRSVLSKLLENFEVQYIFPSEAFALEERRSLIARAGLAEKMKGNMMAVVVDPAVVEALRDAPADVVEKLHASGWGVQGPHTLRNPNSEQDYVKFVVSSIDDIIAKGKLRHDSSDRLTPEGQVRATQHLFEFAMKITMGKISKEAFRP